jgi:hypothetical protein
MGFPHQTVLVKEGFGILTWFPSSNCPREGRIWGLPPLPHGMDNPTRDPGCVIFDLVFMLHEDRFDVRAREAISVLDGFSSQNGRFFAQMAILLAQMAILLARTTDSLAQMHNDHPSRRQI